MHGRQLVVPSSEELALALSQANTLEELVHFEKMVAVMKAAGEQFRLAIDEAIRIASFDLVTRRKIGDLLLQVKRRGGDRTKRHDASLLDQLLQDLGKDKVKRYREIARTDPTYFADYLKLMTEQREVPTEAGMLRYARRARASGRVHTKRAIARGPRIAAAGKLVLPPAVLEGVRRILGEVDVCVGDGQLPCRLRMRPDAVQVTQLRGTIFVADCPYPDDWLPKLAQLRRGARVDAILVALPADTASRWFKALMDAEDEWACCFPTGVLPPVVLAHLGHHAGFTAACADIGPVVRNS